MFLFITVQIFCTTVYYEYCWSWSGGVSAVLEETAAAVVVVVSGGLQSGTGLSGWSWRRGVRGRSWLTALISSCRTVHCCLRVGRALLWSGWEKERGLMSQVDVGLGDMAKKKNPDNFFSYQSISIIIMINVTFLFFKFKARFLLQSENCRNQHTIHFP